MQRHWGPWTLHRDGTSLHLRKRHGDLYWIDLTTIYDRASMQDWILQVHEKNWATTYIQFSLLQALREIFQALFALAGHPEQSAAQEDTEMTGERAFRRQKWQTRWSKGGTCHYRCTFDPGSS